MRILALVLGAVIGLALIAYGAGLGIYAVASTKPRISTQPRTATEAQRTLERLELARDYPFAHRFALLPQGRMHYIDEGSGPVLLCLHGNGSWSLECAELVKARSAKARVIAPDLVGFGLSEKPSRPPVDILDAHAADLAALVEGLDLRDVQIVVSHSSAPIANRLVQLAPERVRSTVLEERRVSDPTLAKALARTPVLGDLVVQGFGGLSPGYAHGPFGRVQGNWDERESSLALARAD
jgi:pimeloyl-ACP methyl ester carboxylesterase